MGAALGGEGQWDEQIARQAAATLDLEVTAAELFPSPPAAKSVHNSFEVILNITGPENITDLDDWIKKVKLGY